MIWLILTILLRGGQHPHRAPPRSKNAASRSTLLKRGNYRATMAAFLFRGRVPQGNSSTYMTSVPLSLWDASIYRIAQLPEPPCPYSRQMAALLQNFPLIPRLQICRELAMKMEEQLKDIHGELLQAPYCPIFQRSTRIIRCRKCNCRRNGLCFVCAKKGINIIHPLFAESLHEIPESFITNCWIFISTMIAALLLLFNLVKESLNPHKKSDK